MERWLIVLLNMIVPVLVTLLAIGIGAAIIETLTHLADGKEKDEDNDNSQGW